MSVIVNGMKMPDKCGNCPISTNTRRCVILWQEFDPEKRLENCPLEEAPERPKGKWNDYPIADDIVQCSCCGILRFGGANYCPNCGAEMEHIKAVPVEEQRIVHCCECKYNHACFFQSIVEEASVNIPYDETTFFCADGVEVEE